MTTRPFSNVSRPPLNGESKQDFSARVVPLASCFGSGEMDDVMGNVRLGGAIKYTEVGSVRNYSSTLYRVVLGGR